MGSGSTNCARVLTSRAGAMVGTAWVCAIAFSSPLLPVASVVASTLERWRNFRRVITPYLSAAKDTTTARPVGADALHLPCRCWCCNSRVDHPQKCALISPTSVRGFACVHGLACVWIQDEQIVGHGLLKVEQRADRVCD